LVDQLLRSFGSDEHEEEDDANILQYLRSDTLLTSEGGDEQEEQREGTVAIAHFQVGSLQLRQSWLGMDAMAKLELKADGSSESGEGDNGEGDSEGMEKAKKERQGLLKQSLGHFQEGLKLRPDNAHGFEQLGAAMMAVAGRAWQR
jgi:hypothetical protein